MQNSNNIENEIDPRLTISENSEITEYVTEELSEVSETQKHSGRRAFIPNLTNLTTDKLQAIHSKLAKQNQRLRDYKEAYGLLGMIELDNLASLGHKVQNLSVDKNLTLTAAKKLCKLGAIIDNPAIDIPTDTLSFAAQIEWPEIWTFDILKTYLKVSRVFWYLAIDLTKLPSYRDHSIQLNEPVNVFKPNVQRELLDNEAFIQDNEAFISDDMDSEKPVTIINTTDLSNDELQAIMKQVKSENG